VPGDSPLFYFFCNVREICSHGKANCLINQKFVARLLPLPCCSAHKQHVAASEFCHLQMRQQLSVGLSYTTLTETFCLQASPTFSQHVAFSVGMRNAIWV